MLNVKGESERERVREKRVKSFIEKQEQGDEEATVDETRLERVGLRPK